MELKNIFNHRSRLHSIKLNNNPLNCLHFNHLEKNYSNWFHSNTLPSFIAAKTQVSEHIV